MSKRYMYVFIRLGKFPQKHDVVNGTAVQLFFHLLFYKFGYLCLILFDHWIEAICRWENSMYRFCT